MYCPPIKDTPDTKRERRINNGKDKWKEGASGGSLAMIFFLKGRTLIILIILVIFFSLMTENFFSLNTGLLVAKHVALYGILGIGMTYVIITGGIDLSVGAVAGLAGMIAGGLINEG